MSGRDMRRRSRSRSPRRGGGGDFRGGFGDNKYVYLSNLPYELRWMELKTLIREKAGEVTFVEIIEQRNGRPKGCALVEFTTVEGAREAIAKLNSVDIQGRNIVAKDIKNPEAFFRIIKEETGVDFLDKGRGGGGAARGGGPGGPPNRRHDSPPRNGGGGGDMDYELFGLSPQFLKKMAITPPLSTRIFAANIAFNATSGCIWDIFSMAGKVTYVDLQIDKEGKSKGQAIVEFSHPLEAVQAISMFHNQKYYDRTLAVKMDRFEKRNQLGKGEMPRGLSSVGMGLGAGGAPLTDIAAVISTMPPPSQQQPPMQPPPMQPPPMQQMQPPMGGVGGGGGPMGYKGSEMDTIMGAINGAMGMGGGGGGGMGMPAPAGGDYKPDPSMYGARGGPQGGGYDGAMMGGGGGAPYGGVGGPAPYGRDAPSAQGGFTAAPARGGMQPPMQQQQQLPPQQQQQPSYGREPVYRDNAPAFGSNPMGGAPGGYNAIGGGGYGSGGGGGGGAMGGYGAQIKKEEYAPTYASGSYPDVRGQQMGGVGVGGGVGGGPAPFSSRVILIKNLPLDYTWQIVRDRSMNFGEVEHCELITAGVARVRFSHNSEAERARGALAGTSVEGRPITVDFVM